MKGLLIGLGLVLLCVGAGAERSWAENLGPGGGIRIVVGDEVIDAYRLLVTVAPEPAQVGTVTFVVRLSAPDADIRIRDARVSVALVHSSTGTIIERSLTHEDAGSPVDYAAHVEIAEPGVWNVTIRVEGEAGLAEVAFTQRVLEPRRLSTVAVLGIPFLVLLGVLGGVWYARAGAGKTGPG